MDNDFVAYIDGVKFWWHFLFPNGYNGTISIMVRRESTTAGAGFWNLNYFTKYMQHEHYANTFYQEVKMYSNHYKKLEKYIEKVSILL